MTLKEAAGALNINYSSAKTVMQTYKHKGRILKKHSRDYRQKPGDFDYPLNTNCSRIFIEQNVVSSIQISENIPNNNLQSNTNEPLNCSKTQSITSPLRTDDSLGNIFGNIDFADYSRKIMGSYLARNGPRLRKLQRRLKMRALPIPKGMLNNE